MANQLVQLNHIFGALSDATRRAIIMRLCEGEASVGELAKPFEMALPSLMKHIGILESSGLVTSEKNGRVRTCSLQTEALATIEVWLAAQREIWEQRLDRLEMYVEKLKKEEKANARKRKSKLITSVHLGARSRDRPLARHQRATRAGFLRLD
jgi:DNA-binding transcriptional ArsR family regulator